MRGQNSKIVLIIEDEKILRDALEAKFLYEGFRVLTAGDGEEGLSLAINNHPDFILLDIIMPRMDGITVLKKLHEDEWGKTVPIIVLTNLSDQLKVTESFPVNVEYLVKSDWSLEAILNKVKEKLRLKGGGENMNGQKGSIWIVMIAVIIVVLLLIGGWYAYKHFFQSQTVQPITQTSTSQQIQQKNVFRVGETIDEDGLPADTKEFQPFIDYLVSQLSARGFTYTKGEFIGVKSVSEMAQQVREGNIDMVIDSAFPVYVVDTLAGAQVLADRWKGGAGIYHTAIFVPENSSIKTLDDLKGKILAFDSNTSTVGYFLPKAELIKKGYTLTQKDKPTDSCKSTEICYIFVHGNVYENVAKGIVPAGAESELEIDAYFGDKINNYRMVYRTSDISRFLVTTRSDMDPKLRDAIGNILFTMDTTSRGREILKSFANTAKFTPVANTDTVYGVIKNLTDLVENEIVRQ